jgi:beta-lactam-binding protein with PASTA domain
MADQLEAWLAAPPPAATSVGGSAEAVGGGPAGVRGAGAGGARAAEATAPVTSGSDGPGGPAGVISGTARANPARVPYPPEAYVGGDEDDSERPPRPDRGAGGRRPPAPRRTAYRNPDQDDDGGGPGAMVWLTGVAAIVMLAAIAFLAYQLVAGGSSPSSGPGQVVVPNFVGQAFDDAKRTADGLQINLIQAASEPSDQASGTILAQDLAVGTPIPKGATVKVTVAAPAALVPVPDLKNRTLSEAIAALVDANLRSGVVSQVSDSLVPAGQVVSQSPGAGVGVAKGTPIDFQISTGPEVSPSASPSPTPTPTPTPEPTPEPTPPPTPEPTAPPTPEPTPPPTPTPTPEPSVIVDPSAAPSL